MIIIGLIIIIIKINIIFTQTRLDNYFNYYNYYYLVDVIIIIALIIIIMRDTVFISAVLILVTTIGDITIIVFVMEKCWKS